MTEIIKLNCEIRKSTGKSQNKTLRNENKIPAIIYGNNFKNLPCAINYRDFEKILNKRNIKSKILLLSVGNEIIKTITKYIDYDIVTDKVQHIDFYKINENKKIKVKIRLSFINQEKCKGAKIGGVINITAREIELLCQHDKIPSIIEIDLAPLKIGDSIHTHNLNLPDGVEVSIKSYDQTIVTITGRTEDKAEIVGTEEDTSEDTAQEQSESSDKSNNGNKQEP
jgi:large subunit ribosomal protein L25